MNLKFGLQRTLLSASLCSIVIFGSALQLQAAQSQNPPAVGTPQNFSGLTLIAPVDLNRVASGAKTVDCEALYQGSYKGIQINVAVKDYAGDPAATLDKDIDDYVKTISKMSGTTEVDRSLREVTVEGAFAKRLNLNITRADKVVRAQVLFVVRGQRVWSVQTFYQNTAIEGDLHASTIIESVRVKGANQVASLK